MPVNNDGTRRPFTDYEKAVAVRYAQELARQGGLTDREMVNRVGARFGFDNSDFLAAWNFVRQAKRSVEAATAATQHPGTAPPESTIPNTAGDNPADRGRFVHDIMIVYTDPTTGQKYYGREENVSDRPLSLDELRDYARRSQDEYVPQRRNSFAKGTSGGDYTVDVQLLDIGRFI